MLLKELQVFLPSPPVLKCDNSRALALASNPVHHAWTKHIEVDIHFVREKVNNQDIKLKHMSTLDQMADIFTKGHIAARFCYLRDKLMVVPPMSLPGGGGGGGGGLLREKPHMSCTHSSKLCVVHYKPTNWFIHNQEKTF
jgi:hypothetical protein